MIQQGLDYDMFRTSTDLEPGKVVNIYDNFKFQSKVEGRATLIERKSKELTFILHNEPLLTKPEERSIHEDGHHLPFTKNQKLRNQRYSRLTAMFIGAKVRGQFYVNPDLNDMYKHLIKEVSTDLDNPKHLINLINEYRIKYQNEPGVKGALFEQFKNKTIVQFIQQTGLAKWGHSIWREERWLVSFDQDRFATPFHTIRKIRTLICISPKEDAQNSEILHYVTRGTSNISNEDRKQSRIQRKKEIDEQYLELDEEQEDSIYTPEELEMMEEHVVTMDPNEIDEYHLPTEDPYDSIDDTYEEDEL